MSRPPAFFFRSGPTAAQKPVLSHGRQIFLAGMLVNQPENERQHDRDSLKSRRWIKSASFQECFVRVLELVTFVTVRCRRSSGT